MICDGIYIVFKKSYTIANHERFFLLHVLPYLLLNLNIFNKNVIVSRTTNLLQDVNKFTHGKSSLKINKTKKHFIFEHSFINS